MSGELSLDRGPVHRDGLRGLRSSGRPAARRGVVRRDAARDGPHLRRRWLPATCSSRSAPAAASIRRQASWPRRAPPARIRSSSIWSRPRAPACSPRPLYGPATEIVPGFVEQTAPRLALEMRDHFDMRREQELIDRRDAGDAVAAIDQDAEIAGERARIAGHGDEPSARPTWQASRPAPRRRRAADRTPPRRRLSAPSRRAASGTDRGRCRAPA